MANIGDLNIDDFLGGELNPDEIRALLSEGQSAYNSVKNLSSKNGQLIGEIRTAKGKYSDVETKLAAKGLTIEQLETLDLNPTNDAQIAQFKQQLDNERLLAQRQIAEIQKTSQQATEERDRLLSVVELGKVQSVYRDAAKVAGVSIDFTDDYFAILQSRGVKMYVDESGAVKGRRDGDVIDYTLDALLTNFKADPSHQKYFASKSGGGSGTVPGMGKAGSKNPFAAESFNMTEQTRLTRENPVLAAQMKELANG